MNLFCVGPASILATIHPYLNPGTGGLIIQLILGGLFAAGLAVRVFWSKIKRVGAIKNSESITDAKPNKDEPE
jgi:hypothetical protein